MTWILEENKNQSISILLINCPLASRIQRVRFGYKLGLDKVTAYKQLYIESKWKVRVERKFPDWSRGRTGLFIESYPTFTNF